VREDSCSDAACFNRKLDAHIAQRITKMANLVMISQNYNATVESPILPHRNYVEVVSRKNKKGKDARPEDKLCSHLTPAIHTDGMNKGRLVKVCADPTARFISETYNRRETTAPVEGGKNRCKQKSKTDIRVPAPTFGRRAQTREAAVWNR